MPSLRIESGDSLLHSRTSLRQLVVYGFAVSINALKRTIVAYDGKLVTGKLRSLCHYV